MITILFKKLFIYILILVGIYSVTWSQNVKKEKNKTFLAGQEAFEKGHYYQAITFFLSAVPQIQNPNSFALLSYQTAKSYHAIRYYPLAEEWYKKSFKSTDSTYYQSALWSLIEVLQNQNKLDQAKDEYLIYEKKYGTSPELEARLNSITFAIEAQKKTSLYKVEMEKKFFSEGANVNPKLAREDQRMLIFSSSRNGGVAFKRSPITGESYLDLYFSTLDRNGKWSSPQAFGNSINSLANDADATFNLAADLMYFTKCTEETNKPAPCRIYRSVKQDAIWGTAERLDEILNLGEDKTTHLMHPFLSNDGKFLFFTSNIQNAEHFGAYDIWYCKFENNQWKNCKNAGKNINTDQDELYPVFQNNRLYFASTGHLGMGGLDLFESVWDPKTETFSEAKNLGFPINSTADDYGITWFNEGKSGFFSSNRDPQYRDQIYQFSKNDLKFDLSILVQDEETRKPIENVKVLVQGHGEDEQKYAFMTDKNGKVFLTEKTAQSRYILPNSTYSVTVSKPEAKMLSEHQIFSTKGKERSDAFFLYFFTKTDRQKPLNFPEVRYDLDKYTLQVNEQVNSKDSLDYLYRLLIDNPTITIELQAHTDTRGSEEYNLKLSQQRAEECVKYLVEEKGIVKARLKAVGFGKTRPKYTEAYILEQPSDEQEEYHQLNRRTEFIVLTWNYSP